LLVHPFQRKNHCGESVFDIVALHVEIPIQHKQKEDIHMDRFVKLVGKHLLCDFEVTMSSGTLCVHDALWDSLPVEVSLLIEKMQIFKAY
jgi:hypothetical protein